MIKVALAPGQSNYYDNLSGVLLNIKHKEAVIADGCRTEGLLDGVRKGKIVVVSGSLTPGTSNYNASKVIPTYYRLLKSRAKSEHAEARAIETFNAETIAPIQEVVEICEEPVVETVVVEEPETVTEVIEEPAIETEEQEEKPAKQPRKRKKKAVEETAVETGDVEAEEVR